MSEHDTQRVGQWGETGKEVLGHHCAPRLSEKQAVLAQVSARLDTIAENLKATIDAELQGPRHGPIVYFVVDPTKDPIEPEVRRQLTSDNLFGIEQADIRATPGFERLQAQCRHLGMKFTFNEEWPEIMCDPKDGYEDAFVWHISISSW